MRGDRKLPVIDANRCRKCDLCITACPLHAINESTNTACAKCVKYCMTMKVPCSPEFIVFDYETCDSCGKCLVSCPHAAIRWFEPARAG